MSELLADAWVRVSRKALRSNWEAVQRRLHAETDGSAAPQVIAVVKANAYGHGLREAAQAFRDAGAAFFAVTTPQEALDLREAVPGSRILMFLPPLPEQMETLIQTDIDLTVTDEESLQRIQGAAKSLGREARVHLKVDTGMGRLGIAGQDALPLAKQIACAPNLMFAGIYTHFARALEPDPRPTQAQFQRFQAAVQQVEAAGIDPGLRHCANSAALLRFPEMWLDAVRPGTILYGQYPSAAVPRSLSLQDSWQLCARIVSIRKLPRGAAVGYGGEMVTKRPTRAAVLPIGYADGFTLSPASAMQGKRAWKSWLKSWARRDPGPFVQLQGRKASVMGRVSMQMTTVDVTDIPNVSVGDVAVVPARRITASAALPRVYED
jgi:alanine racemase